MYRPIYAGSTGRNTHLVTCLQSQTTNDRLPSDQLLVLLGACYVVSMVRGSPNPKHFGLPARLRKARAQSGLTSMAVAAKAGVSDATVRQVATDERLPTVGTIAKIAAALGVSAPWLAYGLGDTTADSAATCEGMGLRLQTVRVERDHTKASLARLAGLSAPSIAQIENGGQAGVDTIETLSKALGVSPGWLAYGIGPMEPPARRRSARSAAASV